MAISNSRKASQSAAPLVMCKPTAVRALSKVVRTRAMPPAAPMPPIEYCAYSNQISGPVEETTSKKKNAHKEQWSATSSCNVRQFLKELSLKYIYFFFFYFYLSYLLSGKHPWGFTALSTTDKPSRFCFGFFFLRNQPITSALSQSTMSHGFFFLKQSLLQSCTWVFPD